MYSLKKGLTKGAISLLTVAAAWVAFTAFSDVTLWSLLENYLKPVLGSVTVAGAITMAINYLKVKAQE
jgi:hypothetical protein